jgi:hypothetical protein
LLLKLSSKAGNSLVCHRFTTFDCHKHYYGTLFLCIQQMNSKADTHQCIECFLRYIHDTSQVCNN